MLATGLLVNSKTICCWLAYSLCKAGFAFTRKLPLLTTACNQTFCKLCKCGEVRFGINFVNYFLSLKIELKIRFKKYHTSTVKDKLTIFIQYFVLPLSI